MINDTINDQDPVYLQLLSVQVLCAPEDVTLGDPLTAQLVDLNHASKGDESHQSGGGQQRQGHLQGLFQSLQVLVLHAGVHHVQKDEWNLRAPLVPEKRVGQASGSEVSRSSVSRRSFLTCTTYSMVEK